MKLRIVVLGALAAVLMAPGFLVDPAANRLADRMASSCLGVEGLDVDSGEWPAIPRALLGRLDGVTATADDAKFGPVPIRNLRFNAAHVNIAPAGLALFNNEVRVDDGEADATIEFADLESAFSIPGIGVDLRGRNQQLVAHVTVPFLRPFDVGADLTETDGDLAIKLSFGQRFPPLTVRIEVPQPARLTDVRVASDHLDVHAVVDGTIDLSTFGCQQGVFS